MRFAKKFGKNLSKILSGKYSQKLLDRTKQSAIDTSKTSSKKVVKRTAEATGDLIVKIQRLPTNSRKISRNARRKIYLSPERRRKIIDELRLI